MGLRSEIKEEARERAYHEARQRIIRKYYNDPDASLRGLGASILHAKHIGERELSAGERRSMELELQLLDANFSYDD